MTVELTADDWIEEAKSAERGETWPQAVALWTRAASLCDGEEEQRCLSGIARCEHEVKVDAELASVARRILDIPTLATRKMDALDFHEVAVWQILAALRLAHRMGRKDGGCVLTSAASASPRRTSGPTTRSVEPDDVV